MSEAVGTKEVAGSSWNHSQTVGVSQVAVGIVGNPGVSVGFGGDEVAGGNTAVSVGLGVAVAAVGIVERAGVQEHGERKVEAGRWSVVGIASSVVQGDAEEAGELVVDVVIGRTAGGVGVAAVASRIGYHHNRSSRKERTAQQEDAMAGLAEEGSIGSCKLRN